MAFLISTTNPNIKFLNKNGGYELPSTGILMRYVYQTSERGRMVKHFLTYKLSVEKELEGWDNISVMKITTEQDENGNNIITRLEFPNQIEVDMTDELIGHLEMVVNTLVPNQPTFVKTILGQHLVIKEELEKILGNDFTIEIRLDLV